MIHASLNWIGVGPERETFRVASTVARIKTRGAISSNNLQMIAGKLERERRRGRYTTSPVITVKLSDDVKPCRVDECPVGAIRFHHKLIAQVDWSGCRNAERTIDFGAINRRRVA